MLQKLYHLLWWTPYTVSFMIDLCIALHRSAFFCQGVHIRNAIRLTGAQLRIEGSGTNREKKDDVDTRSQKDSKVRSQWFFSGACGCI